MIKVPPVRCAGPEGVGARPPLASFGKGLGGDGPRGQSPRDPAGLESPGTRLYVRHRVSSPGGVGTSRLGGPVQPGESHHRNYYNNAKYAADLRRASDVVAQRVKDRDLALPAEARSFAVAAAEAPSRRKNLTGKLYPIGAGSPNGFIERGGAGNIRNPTTRVIKTGTGRVTAGTGRR